MIEAAGGVVWRRTDDGVQVLLVHRPRYDDWSLPKGKLESRESARAAALREVREETGLRCEAGVELPSTRYRDRKGRRKHVRYWAMEVRGGSFKPNREVDQVRWVTPEMAARLVTYPRELAVLDAVTAMLAIAG